MYFKICPDCGVHLDPGERCDCQSDQVIKIIVSGRSGPHEIKEIRRFDYGNQKHINPACR